VRPSTDVITVRAIHIDDSWLCVAPESPGFAITFGGGPFVSDLAENRSEAASDLSENRSETKVGNTRPGQDTKENSFHAA